MITESSVRACAKRKLLFHMTAQGEDVIEAIKQEGLKPGPDCWSRWESTYFRAKANRKEGVVWFTADPTIKQFIMPVPNHYCWKLHRVVCEFPGLYYPLTRFRYMLKEKFRPHQKDDCLVNSTWVHFGAVSPCWIKEIQYLGTRFCDEPPPM